MSRRRGWNEGTLTFDEKRGVWVGRLPRSLDPKRRAVYGKTQSEARDKLRRSIRAAEDGLRVDERTKLGDYLDMWLVETVRTRVQTGKLAPKTAQGYESHVRHHIVPRLGNVPLQRLTVAKVEAMLADILASGRSAGTAKSVRATLSKALSDAMRDELVSRNVAQIADTPTVTRREPSAFTVEEFRRIAAACVEEEYGTAFLFAAYTGLRASEVRGLRWSDIDLDARTYRVRQGVHYVTPAAERVTGESGLVDSKPKSEASGERLPLSAPALEVLSDQRRRLAARKVRSLYVFPSAAGTRLDPSNMRRAWRRVLDRAGVSHETRGGYGRGLHELRRTFATRLRDAGVPLEDVQRLGRWASPQVLLSSYAASSADRLRSCR